MRIFIGVLIAVSVGSLAWASSAAISPTALLGGNGNDMSQRIVFKKALEIPFDVFSEEQLETIEDGAIWSTFQIVFIGGKPVKAVDEMVSSFVQSSLYQLALKSVHPGPIVLGQDSPDVSYCAITVALTGLKTKTGFLIPIPKPQIPYIREANEPLDNNFGKVVITKYGMAVELAPHERPNAMTLTGLSPQIQSVQCLRHSASGQSMRVTDFIRTFGSDLVEVVSK